MLIFSELKGRCQQQDNGNIYIYTFLCSLSYIHVCLSVCPSFGFLHNNLSSHLGNARNHKRKVMFNFGLYYHFSFWSYAPVYFSLESGASPVYSSLESGASPIYFSLESGASPVYFSLESGASMSYEHILTFFPLLLQIEWQALFSDTCEITVRYWKLGEKIIEITLTYQTWSCQPESTKKKNNKT